MVILYVLRFILITLYVLSITFRKETQMKKSDSRILTTHVGSLPRKAALSDLLIRQEQGEKVDVAELDRLAEQAVMHVIE